MEPVEEPSNWEFEECEYKTTWNDLIFLMNLQLLIILILQNQIQTPQKNLHFLMIGKLLQALFAIFFFNIRLPHYATELSHGNTELQIHFEFCKILRGGGAGNDCLNLNFRQNFP